MNKKIIIIGANYLQKPLVLKAKEMGLETHVFAWETGAVAKKYADYFYPISILEKNKILEKAQKINPNGVISIGSDIAMNTVNYVAEELGLIGNSLHCTKISTNKYEMRKTLSESEISCPKFCIAQKGKEYNIKNFSFPLIVKPTDRSGSRGVTKINNLKELESAVNKSQNESFLNQAIIEEFIEGKEYSVEMISFEGQHHYLTVTEKVTTNAPYFVEVAHHQPASISINLERKIIEEIKKSLNALEIKYGASHSEIKIDKDGKIRIIEIGARMGGDLIGSDIVHNSTGYDFVKGVIEVSLNEFSGVEKLNTRFSGVYYVTPKLGEIINIIDNSNKYDEIVKTEIILEKGEKIDNLIDGSGKRAAVFVYFSENNKFIVNPNDVIKFEVK